MTYDDYTAGVEIWNPTPDVGLSLARVIDGRLVYTHYAATPYPPEIEDMVRELFGEDPSIDGLRAHTPPDEDLVATLLDFARAGDAPAFRDLALMRGVPAEEIPAMWAGTVKRVGAKPA